MSPAELTLGARTPAADRAWRGLLERACAPYRRAGRFAFHFARGKLGRDPVFRALLERGELAGPAPRVVDIGCGQGLLASLLQACADAAGAGAAAPPSDPSDPSRPPLAWPDGWPAPPRARSYLGIELMARDVARAELALAGRAGAARPAFAPRFVCADMRSCALPACDRVVILDVLHYVPLADQDALLARVRDALAAGLADGADTRGGPARGRLLLRVGDASDRRGYAASQWVDRTVAFVRGHRAPPTWGRPLAQWLAVLAGLGFGVRTLPMSQGTPFANVLLVAELRAASRAESRAELPAELPAEQRAGLRTEPRPAGR